MTEIDCHCRLADTLHVWISYCPSVLSCCWLCNRKCKQSAAEIWGVVPWGTRITSGAGQIGAAVWASPIGRHRLGAHRLGDRTYGRRDKWALPFRRRTFRRWTTKSSLVKLPLNKNEWQAHQYYKFIDIN